MQPAQTHQVWQGGFSVVNMHAAKALAWLQCQSFSDPSHAGGTSCHSTSSHLPGKRPKGLRQRCQSCPSCPTNAMAPTQSWLLKLHLLRECNCLLDQSPPVQGACCPQQIFRKPIVMWFWLRSMHQPACTGRTGWERQLQRESQSNLRSLRVMLDRQIIPEGTLDHHLDFQKEFNE